MKKIFLLFILSSLFLALVFPVFSYDYIDDDTQEEVDTLNDAVFVISSFVFNIDGRTRSSALVYNADLTIGETFPNLEALLSFVQEKTQILYNQRVLEYARIDYAFGEMSPDGKIPVILTINTRDSWNVIALPRPQYSSNTGLDIRINARDFNFLGTMRALRFDIGYQRNIEGENFFSLMLDSNTPFQLFGLNWNFEFRNDYTFRPNVEFPHFYRNIAGLSMQLPFGDTIITTGISHTLFLNSENPERYREQHGRFHEGIYTTINPFISWRIPTGLHYYDIGEIYYTPRLSATFINEFPQWPLPDFRKGPVINFSHRFDFGRINWNDNFQNGGSFALNHSVGYNFYYLRNGNDRHPLSSSISIRGTGHIMINHFMGFSARFMYRHWFFDDYNDSAGDVLRGVLNNNISANYMVSLNLDLPIRVVRFRPSEWSFSPRFFRIFEFDLHLSPIIDAALYNDPVNQRVFGLENLLLTSGIEMIVFPTRWRSLFLRISYGRNLSLGHRPNAHEIFIGTDLHF